MITSYLLHSRVFKSPNNISNLLHVIFGSLDVERNVLLLFKFFFKLMFQFEGDSVPTFATHFTKHSLQTNIKVNFMFSKLMIYVVLL